MNKLNHLLLFIVNGSCQDGQEKMPRLHDEIGHRTSSRVQMQGAFWGRLTFYTKTRLNR